MSRVSRASSASRMMLGRSANEARIRARLVADFEPGTRTVARMGMSARGAAQFGDAVAVIDSRVVLVPSPLGQ